MRRSSAVAIVVLIAAGILYTGHLNYRYRVVEARTSWQQAVEINKPSVLAVVALVSIKQNRDTIIKVGIATPDSFQAVQSRLNALWDTYCWLYNEPVTDPPAAGAVTIGEM